MVKRIVCNTIEEKAFNEKYMKVPRVDNRLQYLARCCLYRIHKGTCCIASTAMFDAIKTKKINLRSNSTAIGASWGAARGSSNDECAIVGPYLNCDLAK